MDIKLGLETMELQLRAALAFGGHPQADFLSLWLETVKETRAFLEVITTQCEITPRNTSEHDEKKVVWHITTTGDQEAWQDFCEQFMSEDITIMRRFVSNKIVVTCVIRIDPYKPIDSTGSMPSFVDQAKWAKFELKVTEVQ